MIIKCYVTIKISILYLFHFWWTPCCFSLTSKLSDPTWQKIYSHLPTPLARKRRFHWISMKSRLARVAKETLKFQNWSLWTNSRRRYMAKILPIRRKTLSNQSINQSINQSHLPSKVFSPSCPWSCGICL